jgi:branched-chain amino acid transport system permease protein
MFYREAGQFKTSYEADEAIFPLLQDRVGLAIILVLAIVAVPLTMSSFTISSVMIPVLIFALAAIGLNILTGYTGLISLGTGGFMGVGAYACYKLTTYLPGVNIVFLILASGFFSAAVGVLFGLYNYNVSAAIEVPTRTLFGVPITGPTATPAARYLVVLGIVILMTWLASNLVHGRIGRMWMAVRDMDIAAELIGIRLYRTKLLAFAVSSFYCGVAGALMVFMWLGAAEADSFNINESFLILFMVIIGGLGSLIGSFFGAAFIWGLPIVLRALPEHLGVAINAATVEHLQFMIVGALIIFFLIVEPHGLARLWQIGKQKLRVWPFPY